MLSYVVNSIVSPGNGSELLEKPVRILGIGSDSLLVIELATNPTKPWFLDKELLREELDSGAAVVCPEMVPAHLLRSDSEISENEKKSRDKNWLLVRTLVEKNNAWDLITSGFGSTVSRHAATMGVDRKIIYRLLYRYWSMGQTINAFLWNTSKCGGPGKEKSRASGIVPGRPARYLGLVINDGSAILLREMHMTYIRIAYRRFASGKCGSIGDAHDWMLNKFFRNVLSDGTKGDVIRGSYPSINQLYYHGRKFFDELYRLKVSGGYKRYNKDHRPIVGAASQGLMGAGHRYEIDSTIADVYLVHRVNRLWLIGRPVLYVVVDTFTRMIVGIHVGLEGPSWNGARHAIYNALTPKKDFCRRYNINIDDIDWPCAHLPVELVADRAELLSEAGETLTRTLGIDVKILPPFRPDWKSIIESRFRLINEHLDLKFVPGGVDARKMERGDRDYELDAILDIDEFTEIVIASVLVHNKSLRLPHLLSREMIAAEVEPTPLNIWNWSMDNNLLNNKHVSPSELKVSLLPSRECRISRGGISFQGILYTCQTAMREEWLARSHNFKTQYVRVFYDPNSVDNCWIKSDTGFEPLSVAPQHQRQYGGLRMEEAIDMIRILNQTSPDERYKKDNISAQLKGHQEAVIDRARKKRSGQGDPVSNAEFKRDKRTKRSTEVNVERAQHTADLNDIRGGGIAAPDVDEPCSKDKEVRFSRSRAFLKLVVNSSEDKLS